MALSDEWEDEHLTPNGWVSGSYKHDHGHREERPVPPDAVLTVRRHVVVPAMGARVSVDVSESPLISDTARINELLAMFGEPTFGC